MSAPPIPFGNGYRFPLRRGGWVSTLLALQPDVIEAGDPYITAWAALDAGRKLDVPVLGFYHSDLPRLITNRLGEWSGQTSIATSNASIATSTAYWLPAR